MQHLAKYRWHIAQVVAVCVTMLTFFAWAPWMAAEPVNHFPADIAAKLPPNCPAVSVSHGNYTCEWRGTLQFQSVGVCLPNLDRVRWLGISHNLKSFWARFRTQEGEKMTSNNALVRTVRLRRSPAQLIRWASVG